MDPLEAVCVIKSGWRESVSVCVCLCLEINGGSSKMLETCVHLDACSPVYNPCNKYVNLNSSTDVCCSFNPFAVCEWAHQERERERKMVSDGELYRLYSIRCYHLILHSQHPFLFSTI